MNVYVKLVLPCADKQPIFDTHWRPFLPWNPKQIHWTYLPPNEIIVIRKKIGGNKIYKTQVFKKKKSINKDTLTAAGRWDEIFSGFQNKHKLHEIHTHLHTDIVMVQQNCENGAGERKTWKWPHTHTNIILLHTGAKKKKKKLFFWHDGYNITQLNNVNNCFCCFFSHSFRNSDAKANGIPRRGSLQVVENYALLLHCVCDERRCVGGWEERERAVFVKWRVQVRWGILDREHHWLVKCEFPWSRATHIHSCC